MSYFSRLTDIVTCNLTHLLENADDPIQEIEQIIAEMKEGLAGANRSVKTATSNERAIQQDLEEHQQQIFQWKEAAKNALALGDEAEARNSLVRKQEIEDLKAGLEQQHRAAVATREHLTTTLHALEARLAEARRKQVELTQQAGISDAPTEEATEAPEPESTVTPSRSEQIDSELAELKRELGQ
ncbi:PspA/IM30 family protein [Gimesia sp.]|uniref:PspA/IM30 family protein n=1 Tax=Gimesia sp. TaxID=2024833 RepID=UPI0032EAEB1B